MGREVGLVEYKRGKGSCSRQTEFGPKSRQNNPPADNNKGTRSGALISTGINDFVVLQIIH
jgi:hypothetical protein